MLVGPDKPSVNANEHLTTKTDTIAKHARNLCMQRKIHGQETVNYQVIPGNMSSITVIPEEILVFNLKGG